MTIATRAELIERLKDGDPNEVLIYTYWGDSDYQDYKDQEQAIGLIDDALENAVGSVNEYLESQYEDESEGE